MKTIRWILAAGAFGLMASTGDEIISAARFVVFGNGGKPAVAITADQAGAGEFVIFDSTGREVFAVRNGVIVSDDLDRRLRTKPAQQPAAAPGGAAKSSRAVQIEQPDVFGKRPMLKAELLDCVELDEKSAHGKRWKLSYKFTNISEHSMKRLDLRQVIPPSSPLSQYPGPGLTITAMKPNDSDLVTIKLTIPVDVKPENTSLAIVSLETGDGQIRR